MAALTIWTFVTLYTSIPSNYSLKYLLWFKFSFDAKFLKLVQLSFSFVVYSLP